MRAKVQKPESYLIAFDVLHVQYSTVQHSTVQYSTVLNDSTVQHSTVQYSTVQYSTVQYSTVQYSTMRSVVAHVRILLEVLFWSTNRNVYEY